MKKLNGNMTDANTVYSDVIFVKTSKGTRGESLPNTFISLLLNNIMRILFHPQLNIE